MKLSIRWKLTLWYGVVLAAVLTLFSAVVYFVLRHQMLSAIDEGLNEELSDVLTEFQRASDEQGLIQWLDRRFAHHEGFDFQITRLNGGRFFASQRLIERTFLVPTREELSDAPRWRTIALAGGQQSRMIDILANGPKETLIIEIARPLDSFQHESRELLLTFLFTGPLILAVVLGGGYFLAHRALTPVEEMARSANRIRADRLDERIKVANPHDELGSLAQTLNGMIDRLQQSFVEMQRFTADAAHELRTPLAVIRSETEVALRAPRSVDQYADVLGNVLEEVIRLSHTADQLLFLCRQDAQLQPVTREEVATEALLEDVVGNMQLVAQEKGVGLKIESNPTCRLKSDPTQLRRVLYNLLDNAIKYTPAGGCVTISSQIISDAWMMTVADTGAGIAADQLPYIFERFYRADPSRSGESAGAGLGLAICSSIVTRLGGQISVESTPNIGTTVKVQMPRAMEQDN